MIETAPTAENPTMIQKPEAGHSPPPFLVAMLAMARQCVGVGSGSVVGHFDASALARPREHTWMFVTNPELSDHER